MPRLLGGSRPTENFFRPRLARRVPATAGCRCAQSTHLSEIGWDIDAPAARQHHVPRDNPQASIPIATALDDVSGPDREALRQPTGTAIDRQMHGTFPHFGIYRDAGTCNAPS